MRLTSHLPMILLRLAATLLALAIPALSVSAQESSIEVLPPAEGPSSGEVMPEPVAPAQPATGQAAEPGVAPNPLVTGVPAEPTPPPPCGTQPITMARMQWPTAALLTEIHARILTDVFKCEVRIQEGDMATTGSAMG